MVWVIQTDCKCGSFVAPFHQYTPHLQHPTVSSISLLSLQCTYFVFAFRRNNRLYLKWWHSNKWCKRQNIHPNGMKALEMRIKRYPSQEKAKKKHFNSNFGTYTYIKTIATQPVRKYHWSNHDNRLRLTLYYETRLTAGFIISSIPF